jgi:hypothetical protein
MKDRTFLESLISQTARQEKGTALGKDLQEGSPTDYHGYHPADPESREDYWNNRQGGYGHKMRSNRGFQVRSAQQDTNLLDRDVDPNLNSPDEFHDDGTEAIATSPAIHHGPPTSPVGPSGYSSDAGFHQDNVTGSAPSKLKMRMQLIKINGELKRLTKLKQELELRLGQRSQYMSQS